MNDNLSLLSCIRDFALSHLWRRLSDMWLFWLFIKKQGASFRGFVVFQLWRRLSDMWLFIKTKKSFFYLALFVLFSGTLIWLERKLELNVSADTLSDLAFAIVGIIVALISPLLFQNTENSAYLFSDQYLDLFAEELKEKWAFGGLVLFTIASFSISVILPKYGLAYLLIILLSALYIIYRLYLELKSRKNPKIILKKIEVSAIKNLEKIRENYVRMPNKVPENNEKIGILNPALAHVKYLHEMGLKLLAKNEIESFNTAVDSICDIYLKHLELGSGHFTRTPERENNANNYQLFTVQLFHCLQSMGERLIQEKRKENIYHLFGVYKDIINHSLDVKYVNEELADPLLQSVLHNYRSFIEKALATKNKEWSYGTIHSLMQVLEIALQKKDHIYSPSLCHEIHEVMDKISELHPPQKEDGSFANLTTAYFGQIRLAWDKQADDSMFWDPLFKRLETYILSVPINGHYLLVNMFCGFHDWQQELTMSILESKDKWEKVKDDFVALLEKWGKFLFGFAGRHGLNTQIGNLIITSVGINLNIMYMIRTEFQTPDNMDGIYRTNINVFTYFFQSNSKDREVNNPKIYRGNFSLALSVLWHGISYNLKHECFDIKPLINRYIGSVEDYFKHSYDDYVEIMKNLSDLALLLKKYEKTSEAERIRSKINELKDKYQSNK